MSITNFPISGSHGELRIHAQTVALLGEWVKSQAHVDGRVGTSVARLSFSPRVVNKFWLAVGKPTHVALPMKKGGQGGRRVYELIDCDMDHGKASIRTPHVAIEGERR